MSTPTATAMNSRRGLMRWSIAAAATAALVISGSGLVVFAQSGTGESQGPQFAPADAVAYVEARLDMPAGQDEAMAQMMTAFPGFADAGSFDMKLDEILSMLTAQLGASTPEGDLIGDVFTGEMGLALGDLESAMMGEDPTLIIGMAAADPDAVSDVMEGLVVADGTEMTVSTYNDVLIISDETNSPPMSMALHGDWMLLGTGEETVQSSIDVLDGAAPSLAEDPDFTAAWSRLPAARLGAAWMDFSSLAPIVGLGAMMAEGQAGMSLPVDDIAAMLPQDMVASLVAESDRLTLEALITPGEQTPSMAVGTSVLPMSFPAETQVYLEMRDMGAIVDGALTQLAELMAAQEGSTMADGAMGAAGDIGMLFGEESPITDMLGVPLPQFLDFVGDAGVGAGVSSDGLWFGIAGEVIDDAAADQRMASLMTVLRLFTMQMEGDEAVAIETAEVDGVEVTTITLPIDEAMAGSGLPLELGDSIDVAIHDDTLLIGMGDFVESAILSDGTDSLGASEGFLDALGEDTVNSGLMYMNISSLLAELEPLISMMAPEWEQIAPYATGLDRMIAVGSADDEVISARMTVIVGQ